MKAEELIKSQKAVEKWRKTHSNIDSLRKAYLVSIPKQVWASMAFEGEPVSLKNAGGIYGKQGCSEG